MALMMVAPFWFSAAPRVLCRESQHKPRQCRPYEWSISILHESTAIHNDKSRDDHDDEPPCWNALIGNAIVMMKASIDTVSEQ